MGAVPASNLTDAYDAAGQAWNVDPAILQSIQMTETGGLPNAPSAVSPAGAVGLMQIMPATGAQLGVTDPNDPVQSIFGAAKYYRQLLNKYQDPTLALQAYNAGPGRVDAYLAGQAPIPDETAAYVPKVQAAYLSVQPYWQDRFATSALGTKMGQMQAQNAGNPTSMTTPETAVSPLANGNATPTKGAFEQAFDASAPAGTNAPAPSQPQPGAFESAFDAGISAASPKTPPPPLPGQTTAGGLAKNAAAGAVDAGANAINVASDPVGNLIGKPLATLGVFAHDALAPVFGYDRFPPDVRNMLLGDNVPQPGNALVSSIGSQIGVDPNVVQANSPAERITRKVVGNALTAGMAAPAAIVPAAVGAVAGDQAAQAVPAWAAPAAELAGNVAGAAVAVPTALAVGRVAGGAADAINRFGSGSPEGSVAPAANPLSSAPSAVSAIPGGWRELQPGESRPAGSAIATDKATGRQFVQNQTANPLSSANPSAATANPLSTSPAPQSAGAAASSTTEAALTPAQELAYRSTAEGQKLLEPQPVGIPDQNLYVQGVTPNAAEIEQSVNTARELKSLNVTAPDVSQEAKEIAADNNDARALHFAQTAGSPVDIENAQAARAAQADSDLTATWANKTDADPQPVLDLADQLKASPDGRRPLVRSVINSVTNELTDGDGNPVTDPEQLYGVRKHIDDLMSKEASAGDPMNVRAMAQLQQMKASLDGVIEQAAPGFGQYLQNFSDASKPIDSMQVLQQFEPKLFDAQNRMTYNKVQTMMRQVVDSRQAPGINPYKSISDDTMARLWALRDDLRRSASAQELARTPGSDTAQNAWDAARGVMGGMAGDAAIHAGANLFLGPLGSPVATIAKNVLSSMREGKVARRQTARGMQLLRPDQSQMTNPLASP